MKRLIFALFDQLDDATAAIAALEASPIASQDVANITVHRDEVANSDLLSGETGGRRGAFLGGFLGGAAGAILGALLGGPLDLIQAGPLMGALLVGLGGLFFGGLGGAIVGQSEPDPRILPFVEGMRQGGVLVTVETTDARVHAEIDELLAAHGARIREKVMMEQETAPRPSAGPLRWPDNEPPRQYHH